MQGKIEIKTKKNSGKDSKIVKIVNATISIIFFFVFLYSFLSLRNLEAEYSFEQFFPKTHPLVIADDLVNKEFRLNNTSDIVLVLERKKSWLDTDSITVLKRYTQSLGKFQEVGEVLSISSLEGSFEWGKNLYVGPIFETVPKRFWNNIAGTNSFIKPHFLSKDGRTTLILLRLKPSEQIDLNVFKARLSTYTNAYFPDIRFEFGGIPAVQADISRLLKGELLHSLILSFIIFSLVLILVFRNLSGMIIPVICILVINTIVLGSMTAMNIKFDVMLSMLPVLISITVISLVIHSLFRFDEKKKTKSSSKRFFMVLDLLEELFIENLLATVATSFGFLMLCSSDVGMIKQFGLTVAVVNIAVWSLTQLLLIPMLTFFPKPLPRKWISNHAYWGMWILRKKKILFPTVALTALVCVGSVVKLNWNSRLFDDLPRENITRQTTEKIDQQFGGLISYEIVIGGRSKVWESPQMLKRLNDFSSQVQKLPSVGSVISAADFFKKNSLKGNRLPSSSQEASETLFMLSMAGNNPLRNFLINDSSKTRVHIRFRDEPYASIKADQVRIHQIAEKLFPKLTIEEGGIASIVHRLNNAISQDLLYGFWQSLAIIGFLLIFIFRSLRWALVATLPNLIPPLFLMGMLAFSQTPVKPSVAIVFSIVIGLAFINTIYLLGRLRRMQRASAAGRLPVKRMLLIEGNACLVATLLVMSGFLVFLFSYFKINQLFGIYMISSIVAAAIGDLVFMPTLLALFPGILQKKVKEQDSNDDTLRIDRQQGDDENDETEEDSTLRMAEIGKIAASVIILLLPFWAYANEEAKTILKKTEKSLLSRDDSGEIKMRIIESDGSSKMRKIQVKRKNGDKHYTLVRIVSPKELKGTALLNVIDKSAEEQWLYLPSSKQVRRVVGNNKEAGILGSELTPQDLDITTLKGATAKVKEQASFNGETVTLIEIGSMTNMTKYSKALAWISNKTYVPLKLEYFDHSGKVLKQVEFKKYGKFGKAYRAQSIVVKNLQNKRSTEITLSKVKTNTGIPDSEFTERALASER